VSRSARSSAHYDTVIYTAKNIAQSADGVISNPYKGLRAFQEADTVDFFGRTVLTRHLLDRLSKPGALGQFLAVVGPSGSGKSSVVRAGIIPALRANAVPGSQNWFIATFIPGPQPLDELATALLRVAVTRPQNMLEQLKEDQYGLLRVIKQILPVDMQTELLLVIDQFEEVFTLVEDEAVRTHFLNRAAVFVSSSHSAQTSTTDRCCTPDLASSFGGGRKWLYR
jgi:hypothetical protein